MNPPDIRIAEEADRNPAIHSLILSFSSDPLVRWIWPEPSVYLAVQEGFDAFGGGAIDSNTAYVAGNFEGIAFWMPPGVEPDEDRMVAFLQRTVPEERQEAVFGLFEKMDEFHPEETCWYLPTIGVDPACQGKGIGSQLMKHALQIIDEAGLPAYLESSNPRNISLYERHGFEIVGQIQVADSPVAHPMFREARS